MALPNLSVSASNQQSSNVGALSMGQVYGGTIAGQVQTPVDPVGLAYLTGTAPAAGSMPAWVWVALPIVLVVAAVVALVRWWRRG